MRFKSFTSKHKGDIIFVVKVNKLLKICLAALTLAAVLSAGSAYGAENSASATSYPASFERTLTFEGGPTDYSVAEGQIVFAYNTGVYCLTLGADGDKTLQTYTHGCTVSNIETAEGRLYVKGNDGLTYVYPDKTQVDFSGFQSLTKQVFTMESGCMYTLDGGELDFRENDEADKIVVGTGFSKAKIYSGELYAVKDGLLYKMNAGSAEAVDLSYTDYSAADKICAEEALKILKSDGYTVATGVIADGAYYTQIDPDKLEGTYFTQIKTNKAAGEMPCLILAKCSGAAVVALQGGLYVTAAESITDSEYCAPDNDWSGKSAYVTQDAEVYSSVYMCPSTMCDTLTAADKLALTVTEKVQLDYVDGTFYRISYKKDGTQKTGFIAAGYLCEYSFAADDYKPSDGEFENYSDKSNAVTVVLAVAIVGLVLIAVLYLFAVATKNDNAYKKRGKKKKPSFEELDDDDEE